MSDWKPILDALEAEIRAAAPDVPGGPQGLERGQRPASDLTDPELPHVFLHSPTEQSNRLEHGQEQVLFEVQVELWVRGQSQEEIAARLDLLRDRVRANPTLGGLVDFAFFTARGIRQFQDRPSGGFLLLRTEKVA